MNEKWILVEKRSLLRIALFSVTKLSGSLPGSSAGPPGRIVKDVSVKFAVARWEEADKEAVARDQHHSGPGRDVGGGGRHCPQGETRPIIGR